MVPTHTHSASFLARLTLCLVRQKSGWFAAIDVPP